MRSQSIKWVIVSAVASAVVAILWIPTEAQARSPQTTSYVFDVIENLEPNYRYSDQTATVFAGIDQCRTLVSDNRTMNVVYQTQQEIIGTDVIDGVYHYNFARGEGNQISCRTSDGVDERCEQLAEEDVEIRVDEVEASITIEELTGLTDPSVCTQGEMDRSYYIQLRIRQMTSTGTGSNFTEWAFSEARLVLDLIRPDQPVITDALATENSIRVEFEPSETEDVERHLVVHSRQPFEAGDLVSDISTVRSPRAVEGEESGEVTAELVGGDTVYVGMVSRDEAGNFSPLSAPIEVTVIETQNFWDYYVDAGGAEAGGYGCASAATTTTPLWFVVVLVLVGWMGIRRQSAIEVQCTSRKDIRR